MKSKICAGMIKISVLAVLTTALAATPVLAANGDLWSGGIDKGNVQSVILKPATFLDLLTNTSNYSYEVNGLGYDILAVDAVFNANPTLSESAVQALLVSTLTGKPLVNAAFAVLSID